MNILTNFASEQASSGGIFESLGVDWKNLLFQIVAFLILVFLLSKFVYPALIKSLDKRQEEIDSASKAASEAEKKASLAEDNVKELLEKARQEAVDIVATAKETSASIIESSETKAKTKAQYIIDEARSQLEKDITAARKTLYNDTLDLVALASEKVIGSTLTPNLDKKIIANSVKESNK